MSQSRSGEDNGLSPRRVRPTNPVAGKVRKMVPDYEKPLEKTGEARLWMSLNSGDRVAVVHGGNYSRTGAVDQRTHDGSTVWILLDHGMGRIAVTQGDQTALVHIE